MNRIKVLLVEDESTLVMILKETLEGQGFDIETASDGEEGLKMFFEIRPDIVVADIMMPKMDGLEMVRRIRQMNSTVPVLFLTAKSAVNDVVEGFETGADDYLKKPFAIQELIIRIKALLGRAVRREQEEEKLTFQIGKYQFDPVSQLLRHTEKDTETELSHRESEILRFLCINEAEVTKSQDLLLELWGDDNFFNQKSLHVFITKLRRKLSQDENIRIINVRGIGYKLLSNRDSSLKQKS